jgi:flagellin
MRINTNLTALNTFTQYTSNNAKIKSSVEKLSSGSAINNAADNAAGLAISEKMRAQIRGLEKASTNAQDAISLVQTAEGSLNETTEILQRMRELAAQSASDTNEDEIDREALQDEFSQLQEELNDIARTPPSTRRIFLTAPSPELPRPLPAPTLKTAHDN